MFRKKKRLFLLFFPNNLSNEKTLLSIKNGKKIFLMTLKVNERKVAQKKNKEEEDDEKH